MLKRRNGRKLVGPPIVDPGYAWVTSANGLGVQSYHSGTFPHSVLVGKGCDAKVRRWTSDGSIQHDWVRVESFNTTNNTLSGYYLYEEGFGRDFLKEHHPDKAKKLDLMFPETLNQRKISKEIWLFATNHRAENVPIDSVDDVDRAEPYYEYESEEHRQKLVYFFYIDVLDFTLHRIEPESSPQQR